MLDETKLFDFVKIMFTRKDDYKKIKQVNKKRHHFMINRFFAIKYPTNAQAFNVNGIEGASVVDCWSLVASRFKSVPGWIYTKTKRSKKNEKDKYIPDPTTVQIYMERNEIGNREFEEMKKFAKESLYDDLMKIEKQINVYTR
jgi:hypothetical protein